MKKVFEAPKALSPVPMHYCPGCTHGITHRQVAEVIDELGILERTVGIAPVGCAVLAYNYFECDMFEAAHGRAPAVATGVKRTNSDLVVFTYQGDGDLASIGTAEIIHAAMRGEKITVIFINNTNYGMTGGQMAPTTLVGQKTATTPFGRKPEINGYPIKMAEMLSLLEGSAYIARTSTHSPGALAQTKNAINKAFKMQLEGRGFSMVEILSTCPTNWGLTPVESLRWLQENMLPVFPLGEFKTPGKAVSPAVGGANR